MKRILAGATVAMLALTGAALPDSYSVGDRVHIGSTNDDGVVIEVGQPLADGGTMIKVHLDRLGAAFPTIGSWYDTLASRVTRTGHGGAPAAAPVRRAPTVAQPVQPAPGRGDPVIPNPPSLSPSAAACQQLIRANYPPTGADQTITVNFQLFQMSGPRPYVATYANDNVGRGHTVSASPIHARYTVLTHYDNPRADDELRTYDAQFMCYKSAAGGGWVVEMVSRLPGGEHAQYIHKQ